ncbi:hypothetical protein [Leptolyngbya sp. FACHB-261]|uniref:hypothetical protein n=1 Tax=Leptolyngbya sp. FACHB-261 TaxID=2692806 RepID=UPI001683F905|nr:hypothetical protein [Leptolyngbya sp. FACHB-261]MBD2099379.1 hypothetical protein [Leptolyngbya sp. FACHB-261]
MDSRPNSVSCCRVCRHYSPTGRRGGGCQLLGVPVRSQWSACHMALPPFAPTWENRSHEEMAGLVSQTVNLNLELTAAQENILVSQPLSLGQSSAPRKVSIPVH